MIEIVTTQRIHIFMRSLIFMLSMIFVFGVVTTRTISFAQTAEQKSTSLPSIGDHASDFSLQDFKGNTFTFSEHLKNNGIVLWFTNLCSGCQSKMSEMEKVKKQYEKKGIEVVAISQLGEDRETVEKTIREKKLTFRFLYDPKGEVTTLYSGKYIPGTCPMKNIFFIDKDGKINYTSHYPGIESKEFESLLDKLSNK